MLAAGGRYAGEVNLQAFIAQREETGAFWMAVNELVSTHPYLCKRAAALEQLARPGTVPAIARNPLAYPFAPFFGMTALGAAGSSVMMMVAVIGMLAALAIPNFIKFQQRMKERAAAQQMIQQDSASSRGEASGEEAPK